MSSCGIAARRRIETAARRFAPDAVWCEVRHAPDTLVSATGESRPWQELAGQPVAAFCGVGNPQGFRKTLESCGMEVVAWREFPDHHSYTRRDVDELTAISAGSSAVAAVCTRKALVKVQLDLLGRTPLWALSINTEFTVGQEALSRSLEALIAALPTESSTPAAQRLPG